MLLPILEIPKYFLFLNSFNNLQQKGEKMPEAESQICKMFYKFMTKEYNLKIVNKADSSSMKIISWFLNSIGIVNQEDFLKNFTTTIGRTIYIPYKIGEGDIWEIYGQIKTLVHEVVHVEQCNKEGFAKFSYNYIFNKDKRAEYEAEAYRTDMVLDFHFSGAFRQPHEIVKSLRSYGLDKKHIEYAEKYLELSKHAIERGATFNAVTKKSIDWLELNGYTVR